MSHDLLVFVVFPFLFYGRLAAAVLFFLFLVTKLSLTG